MYNITLSSGITVKASTYSKLLAIKNLQLAQQTNKKPLKTTYTEKWGHRGHAQYSVSIQILHTLSIELKKVYLFLSCSWIMTHYFGMW